MTTTPEQKRELRREWVKALRSGEYKQGKHNLRSCDDAYCCLGVLCHVVEQKFPGTVEWVREGGGALGLRYAVREVSAEAEFSTAPCQLPVHVMQLAGIREELGDFKGSALSSKNDAGVAFSKIADIIESEPEGLFVEDDLHPTVPPTPAAP